MNNTFFKKGVEIVTKAIQSDTDGKYREAYDLYISALETFMTGLKCTCC